MEAFSLARLCFNMVNFRDDKNVFSVIIIIFIFQIDLGIYQFMREKKKVLASGD